MSFITDMFSSSVGEVVDSVGDALDKLITSDEERGALKNELATIKAKQRAKMAEMSADFEKQVTKRWLSDNEHIITRLVRPISYITILTLFLSVVLADGNLGKFHVRDDYIDVLEVLMTTMTVAYFGGRSYEKGKRV